MKTVRLIAGAALLLSGAMTGTYGEAVESDIDGATPGKWTMDFDAAKKVAAEKDLPILLDFSGTDWCSWCKIMEENVFSKPEWAAYAKDNLMMVLIDFPTDKSLVPEKYTQRNAALKEAFDIRGFPTFIVLESDGQTELGRLRSGRNKTPESFQDEMATLFRFRAAEMEKYCKTLSPEKQAAFRKLAGDLTAKKDELEAGKKAVIEANENVETLTEEVAGLKEDMLMFRVGNLSDAEQKKFKELKSQLETATTEIKNWLDTKPERNDETVAKYNAMQVEISELEKQLSKF
ncbi:thioredoxin family protein [Pontiella sp.]|uniref:thioredoxin family protein n=1 Tax=Pontiella sp. TaxID=2837462 RepID=UPI003568FF35